MYKIVLCVLLSVFFPLITFAAPSVEKTEKYLSDLEQEIKQDMDRTKSLDSASSSNVLAKEIGQNHNVVEKDKGGNFAVYFTTISEKKHPLVDFYIRYYSTFGKKKLEEALSRLKEVFPVIIRYANQEKLPLETALIPLVENEAKLGAVRGDRGGMWLLPKSTAQIYNLRMDDYTDERLDMEKSTKAALTHFASLKEAFNGNWDLALTAFNGGGAYFNQKIRELGIDNFWDLLEKETDFSSDTLEYVPKFYALLTLLKHPKNYGIDIPSMNDDKVRFTNITLSKSGVAFKEIARLTNVSTETITRLNPQLSRQYTVKGMSLYIPANTKYLMTSRMRVAKAIKLRYLPASGGNVKYGSVSRRKTVVAKKSAKKRKKVAKVPTFSYRVKANDTLFGIAKKYNVSVSSLMDQNGLSSRSILRIGKLLKVPRYSSQVAKRTNSTGGVSYTVKPGDTVYSIAKNYNVSMDKVTHHNNGKIKPGDHLIILK